jgi:hypothetical protein
MAILAVANETSVAPFKTVILLNGISLKGLGGLPSHRISSAPGHLSSTTAWLSGNELNLSLR